MEIGEKYTMLGFDFNQKNRIEKEIFSMYKNMITGGHCDVCYKKDESLKKKYNNKRLRSPAQSIWHIGKNLSKDNVKNKVVFVGKNSWSIPESLEEENDLIKDNPKVYDCRDMGPSYFYFPKNFNKSPYWDFVKDIVDRLDLTLEDIAITNLCKCNIYYRPKPDSKVITNKDYFKNCIDIFEKEIEIIKPNRVILLTGEEYDSYLENLSYGYKGKPQDLFNDHKDFFTDDNKNMNVPWWHRKFSEKGRNDLHLLRTRHPQGAPIGLKEGIVKWVKTY